MQLPKARPWRACLLAALTTLSTIGFGSVLNPSNAAPAPTLVSDKADYSPHEIVHLTGSGYTAGAAYDLPVRRPDGSIVKGDGSFAPGWDSVTADGSGAIAYNYALDGVFGIYEARVYPSSWSGNWDEAPLASVSFRDADVNLDQCANDEPGTPPCEWQNGDLNGNNSEYAEGDVVPFRLAIERLDPGEHTIHLNYDFTAQGHKAYDFLATYNATEMVDLCASGGGGVSSLCPVLPAPIVVPFPSDPFVANGQSVADAQTASGVSQNLYVFGATSVLISPVTHAGNVDGNSTGDLIVTFTTDANTNPEGQVLLAWGGHLASSAYWMQNGQPDGAGQISGAPWHMRTQQLDGEGNKNQDRSIQPSALVTTQSITVVKNTVPDGPQDFTFTPSTGVNGGASFVLDDDGLDGSPVPSQLTFTVTPGVHTVAETAVPGFDLTSIVCVDPSGGSAGAGTTATFDVAPGEDVTCTFTNTARGSVTVVKDTVPDGPEDATFDPSGGINGGAEFVLDDDGPNVSPTANSMTFEVVPGVHTVTETATQGSDLTGIACVDPTNDSTVNLATATATFNVAPGERVICTFTNTRRGTITVVKDTVPDGPADFTFTPSAGVGGGASFILDDDGPDGSNVANTRPFTVLSGTHTVTEAARPGWTLTSIVCDDADSTGSVATRTATFRVSPGEDVHCTFTNKPAYGSGPDGADPGDPYGADPGDSSPDAPYVPIPGLTGTGLDSGLIGGGLGSAPVVPSGSTGDPGTGVVGETVKADPAPESGLPAGLGSVLPRTGAGAAGELLLALVLVGAGLLIRAATGRRSPIA
jgi:hypothetical protein